MDKIRPKLIKLSAEVLNKALIIVINSSFNKGLFSDNAEITCASYLDKHTDDKHAVTNLRPVNVLNTSSRIYQTIVKDFLIRKMEHHFSLLVLNEHGL